MAQNTPIKSVAIIGAGASGAVAAAAFAAENYFERIRVFERRETPGGTWIYDADPQPSLAIHPGSRPSEIDPPLQIPTGLPRVTTPNQQERYALTPIYDHLTTNVPDIAMCFSDAPFAYGPFVPHYIPRQYLENYFSTHKTDSMLMLNTTLEDLSKIPQADGGPERWKLTLRKYDRARHVDIWWEEEFDGVVLANGHYSVPYVPNVTGLEKYSNKFSGRVVHSKYYRSPLVYRSKKVLVIGNSASGRDVSLDLVPFAQAPVYVSRRSRSRWEGDEPPPGIAWKPTVKEYLPDGRVVFEDGTVLDGVDAIIYCTGYQPSFPFWNSKTNGRELFDYQTGRLIKNYWHTFFQDFPSLGIVGLPRALTFRSFEYQAVALSRLFSGRNSTPLPPVQDQERWERERAIKSERERTKFHDVPWDNGETFEWFDGFFKIAGLGTLRGEGRIPPVLSRELIWAIEHVRKWPEPGKKQLMRSGDESKTKQKSEANAEERLEDEEEWVLVRGAPSRLEPLGGI